MLSKAVADTHAVWPPKSMISPEGTWIILYP